ncbi:MAG: DUF2182 domain-containing protein [Pseudomonadota bacterium]
MFVARIRQMGGAHWIALFSFVLVSWIALWMMMVPPEVRALSAIYGPDFWRDLCAVGAGGTGFFRLWLMWSLMAGAMMAPTALPAFAVYDDLPGSAKPDGGFAALVVGYLTVWFGAAGLGAAAQIWLATAGLTDMFGASRSTTFTAVLLASAGLYQFSTIKESCLAKCRRPLSFFMAHFSDGPFRMGLRLGAVCLGCCWALMALAFVGGMQSLAFMGGATVLMVLEKLPEVGRYLTKPVGFGLIAAAAVLGIMSI